MCTFGSWPFAEIELNGGSRFRDDLDLDLGGFERSVSSQMPGVCRRMVWMSCSSMDDIIIVRWWCGGGDWTINRWCGLAASSWQAELRSSEGIADGGR
jgi:hypothetical protein